MKDTSNFFKLSSITKIKKITDYLDWRISELEYHVNQYYSKTSKSRYLEVFTKDNERINIRISDHPPNVIKYFDYDFDIYNKIHREGAINFIEFLEIFKDYISRT